MRQRLVLFGLCLFALVRYGSNCSSRNSNVNPNPNPNPDANPEANPTQTPAQRVKTLAGHQLMNSDSDYEATAHFPDDIHPTIINGTTFDGHDSIPYQLSIRFHDKPPFGPWKHICGAVILDENTAITAAHCFVKSEDESRYRVVAGEKVLHIYEKQEQILQVGKIVVHPEYTDISNGHDIAILHVDKIQFNEHVRPVLISPVPNSEIANLTGVISGWGKPSLSDSAQVSNSLQKGNVTILSPKDCHPRLRRLRVAVAGILCAVNPDTRPCGGDSGGPLVIQNYRVGNLRGNLLVGIISFGAGKCDIRNSEGFFTEVRYFYDWIQEERAKNLCADGTDEIECSGKTTETKSSTATPVVTPSPKRPTPSSTSISSCNVAMEILPSPRSKKQTIYPHGNSAGLEVLCDFETDGGGWTIIQKRTSGPKEQFEQNWTEYQNGFGSLDGNFWLGLENIHALTQNGDQELRIDLEDFEGNKTYAKYSSFSISDASDFYRLAISGFSENSTARDWMDYNNRQRFSTMDKDNVNWSGVKCAVLHGDGGWWFNMCGLSSLNGLYFEKGETVPHGKGVRWSWWEGGQYSLSKSEMKIRKKKP